MTAVKRRVDLSKGYREYKDWGMYRWVLVLECGHVIVLDLRDGEEPREEYVCTRCSEVSG